MLVSPYLLNALSSRFTNALPPSQRLAIEIILTLRIGVQTADNVLSRWLARDGLTPGRWQVLMVLWSAGGPIPQSQIVDALKVSRATISDLVEVLRTEGHVTLTPGQRDKRQVLVELTEEGSTMAGRLIRENAQRLRNRFSDLSDEELTQLRDLLTRACEEKPEDNDAN